MPEAKKTRRRSSSSKRSQVSSSKRSSRRSRSRKPPTVWSVIGVLLLLILGYLSNEGYINLDDIPFLTMGENGSQREIATEPELSTGAFQVFFTTPYLVYPDERSNRTPPPFEQTLLADIEHAQTQVDVAAFEYNLESVAEALLHAHQRGVTVRLALDRENLEDPDDAAWAGQMEEAGIPISWEDSTAFLHSKFAIIDSTIVWMGSWNFTNNGTYRNNNNLLRFTIPAIVENYQTEFSQMFDEELFGNDKEPRTPHPLIEVDGTRIENYFSPNDGVAEHVVARVQSAQHSIRFLTFSYTDDATAEAMLERHAAGVTVQGVFETRNARGTGSEHERLKQAGLDVLEDGNCYTMHHKVIIIDDATVITGSYNFTGRAEKTNDENLVIIDNPELANAYVEEFYRVYGQAQNPTQCGR